MQEWHPEGLRVSMHSYALPHFLYSLLPLPKQIHTECGKLVLLGMTRAKVWKSRDVLGAGSETAESPVIVTLSAFAARLIPTPGSCELTWGPRV